MAFLESSKSRPQEDMPFTSMDQQSAMAEHKYWTELISGVAGSPLSPSRHGDAGPRLLWDLARFDTSVDCITGLFHILADEASEVPCSTLCKLLMRECRITASTSALEQACDKVYFELHGVVNSSPGRADFITFCVLWQRIMLAAVYSEDVQMGTFDPRLQSQVHVIRYGTGGYVEELVTECQWTFGGYFAKAAFDTHRRGVIWLRIDDALPSEVIRIGIKMYFHPLLIEDLLSTRTTCITQATCFREHHCVCLELYYLWLEGSEEDMSDSDSSCDSGSQGRFHGRGPLSTEVQGTVCSRIRRGVVTFVAPTARGADQHSVLTFLDSDEKSPGQSGTTRSNFLASQAGVKSYLDLVQQRIRTHFQLREQPAGVLLHVILNSADRQLRIVCDAYAERLSLLKRQTIGGGRGGGTYTLEELLEACKGFWSQQEVEEFWKAHCTKLPLSANVEDQVEAWLGTPAKDHEAWMDAESPRVVSLGAWCCPTLAAREMGVGGSSLPFDWSRSTLSSVVRALRTDFAGFLEYHEVQAHASRPDGSVARDYRHDLKEEANVPFKDVYICDGHSFWHDDLWDEREWVKYDRRIRRFLRLAEARLPVLFVRAASHSDELGRAAELLEVLQEKFGESAHLLLLLSYQPSRCTVFITEHPSLLVATLGMHFDRAAEWVGMLPLYVDAMWNAIRYMQSGTLPRSHVVLPSLEVCLANKGVLFQDVDFGDDHTSHWTPFPHSILEQERAMARLGGASIFA